eukprot:1456338-Pyramimonas_sp.AAC.1
MLLGLTDFGLKRAKAVESKTGVTCRRRLNPYPRECLSHRGSLTGLTQVTTYEIRKTLSYRKGDTVGSPKSDTEAGVTEGGGDTGGGLPVIVKNTRGIFR